MRSGLALAVLAAFVVAGCSTNRGIRRDRSIGRLPPPRIINPDAPPADVVWAEPVVIVDSAAPPAPPIPLESVQPVREVEAITPASRPAPATETRIRPASRPAPRMHSAVRPSAPERRPAVAPVELRPSAPTPARRIFVEESFVDPMGGCHPGDCGPGG